MVYCVYLIEKDMEFIKKYDMKVFYNIVSNMYLFLGVVLVLEMFKKGIIVSLGVDGVVSNNF